MAQDDIYQKINIRLEALMEESDADRAALERGELEQVKAAARQVHRTITLENIRLFLQYGPDVAGAPTPLSEGEG